MSWIQEAIKRPGRVRNYLKRKYGKKAFTKDGDIKVSYIRKALKTAKSESLKRALRLALTLKRLRRGKKMGGRRSRPRGKKRRRKGKRRRRRK